MRVFAEKRVSISRVLDKAQKLYQQFLLRKIETLPSEFIDDMLKLDDTGFRCSAADEEYIGISF